MTTTMRTINVTEEAYKAIEKLRKQEGNDREFNRSLMCTAMMEVIDLIINAEQGVTIPADMFYPLSLLCDYQKLKDALMESTED